MTRKVDSGSINNVAPSSESANALVESLGSLNGMTYPTADGTRIPNLGQKTCDDATQPTVPNCGHMDAGNLVVFGRKGGFIVNPDTARRLNFQREHGVHFLKNWSQEHSSFQATGLRSFQRCSSPELRSTERSEPLNRWETPRTTRT